MTQTWITFTALIPWINASVLDFATPVPTRCHMFPWQNTAAIFMISSPPEGVMSLVNPLLGHHFIVILKTWSWISYAACPRLLQATILLESACAVYSLTILYAHSAKVLPSYTSKHNDGGIHYLRTDSGSLIKRLKFASKFACNGQRRYLSMLRTTVYHKLPIMRYDLLH